MALAASACATTEQESKLPRDLTGPADVADALAVGDATDELVVAGVLDDLDEDEPHPASTIAAETANASPAAALRGPISNPLNHKPLSAPKRTPATRPIGTHNPRSSEGAAATVRAIALVVRSPRVKLSPWREAVGKLPGSDDFLYINDKESILSWVISVSEALLRPLAALL